MTTPVKNPAWANTYGIPKTPAPMVTPINSATLRQKGDSSYCILLFLDIRYLKVTFKKQVKIPQSIDPIV